MKNSAEGNSPVSPGYGPLQEKTFLVSGRDSAQGCAIAALLGASGATVFLLGHHESELREALNEVRSGRGAATGINRDPLSPEHLDCVFPAPDRELEKTDLRTHPATAN